MSNPGNSEVPVSRNRATDEHGAPRFKAVTERVSERGTRAGDSVAVRCGADRLTWTALDASANQLAHRLLAAGVQRGDLVGICLERGTGMAVAVLGVLKAGAAYVPVDPAYPVERIGYVLADSAVDVVVSRPGIAAALGLHDRRIVDIDAPSDAMAAPVAVEVAPEDPAYVIYTSGSTGKPKGVVITHGNLSHYLDSLPARLDVRADDVYLHTASIAFSSSVRQLFVPLCSGAEVVIAPRELTEHPLDLFEHIRDTNVSIIDFVPSYWRACNHALRSLPADARAGLLANRLRLALSASEPLPSDVIQETRALLGEHVRAVNMFGQTETTGIVATFEIPKQAGTLGPIVPVGTPIPGIEVHILDASGQAVEPGVVGEVFVGGAGVGAGYLNRPELTAERFMDDRARFGTRLYRTGDRGRFRPDGVLEFAGREDDQVKIRGFRVELEEIEAALRGYPAIREAAVTTRVDADGQTGLIAFASFAPGQPPTVAMLRRHLLKKLPDYMMPRQFGVVHALPRTPNGKLDRRALTTAEPEVWLGSEQYLEPRTDTERVIAHVWAEILEVPRVGARDGFLELGGHSLMAHRVAVRLRQALGVEVSLRDILNAATVEQLAARVEAASHNGRSPLSAIARVERAAELPLSNAQTRLWVLSQMHPESTAYNLAVGLRLTGKLDVEALNRALTEVVRRHESLRTRFPSRNGEPAQVVLPPATFELPLVDLSASSDEQVQAAAEAEVRRVFDLENGPLFRGSLLRSNDSEHLLVLTMHHIISDGWSRGVLYREIATLFGAYSEGADSPLADLPVQYADFAAWHHEWLDSGSVDPHADYWKQQLGGALPVLDLPTDRPRPPVQGSAGRTQHFVLPPLLAEQLRGVAAQDEATLFMTLLAAFNVLLHRYSGQSDILVGSPVAGRSHVETESLIGFFVNTLVLRTDLSGDPSFRELLRRVRDASHAAYEHQDVPFERVVDELGVPRDLSRSPLFQVMFILQNTPTRPFRMRGLEIDHVELDTAASKFDLTLSISVDDDGLRCAIEYATDLYDPSTIGRMAGHFATLLEAVVRDPDARISDLPLLSAAEKMHLLEIVNATDTPHAASTVHELFEQQVERTPDATAIVCDAQSLTYRELNERANQIAHHLRRVGVGPDTLVGISVSRSVEMMVGLLGILKAGGAYVPLDPSYPSERLAVMLEDSGAPLLLTGRAHAAALPAENARIILLDDDSGLFASESTVNPAVNVQPHNLAYVIYTSGSTGTPKGVMVEHRNVVNFFTGMDERVGAGPPGTWLAVTSISFDISVLELFWTLARGFKVVIQSEEGLLSGGGAPLPDPRPIDFGLFYFASNESENSRDKYRLLLEGARFADANGFSSVWTPERHFHAFGGLYPNPSVTSAAIAAITKNVQIRAGSVVLPLHHPLRVAEEWSVVDNLSNGRVGIAVASGWHDRDFVFAPQNYANRRDVMMNGIETLRTLWRGGPMKATTGAGKETDISILPRPIQPELPIWITAAGTPDTYRSAGEIGANVLTHLLGQSVEQLREKIEIYRTARRAAGHPGEGIVTLMMHTYIGRDIDEVREKVYHPFREYLRTSVGLIKELAEGRGQDLRSSSFTQEDMEALLDHAFERYWRTAALLGTPDTCMEVVETLKQIGVNEVACLIDFGIEENAVFHAFEGLLELKQRANTVVAPAADDFSIAAQCHRHGVTHMQCTPSLATMLLAQPAVRRAFGSLRKIMIGGEAFPPALATELRKATSAEILNMYGPTETTIWSSTSIVKRDSTVVPLGRPIANTQLYVLDAGQRPVPVGVPGELYIGGAGVVRGYHNRRELTDERFVPNPFGRNGRLYRTGDLVRYRGNGDLEFLGRTDYQVKVLGHRIELGEIESVLARHRDVRECVVTARDDGAGDKRLVAYVVSHSNALDVAGLRQAARAALPEFMVPAHFVALPDLPRTPNNKVDRKALPAPELVETKLPLGSFTPPGNELERQIAAIWQEILRVPNVGTTDNFFDLGGNSFLAVRVHARLRSELNQHMPLTALFRFPTVAALASHYGGAATSEASPSETGADRAELRKQAMRRRRQLQ